MTFLRIPSSGIFRGSLGNWGGQRGAVRIVSLLEKFPLQKSRRAGKNSKKTGAVGMSMEFQNWEL